MTDLIANLTHEVRQRRQQLVEEYREKQQPHLFFRDWGKALDHILSILWQEKMSGSHLCLMAIGGYGRGEMYPHSDLDIAIVSANDMSAAEQERAVDFVQALWAIGLEPAPKMGGVAEICSAAAQDLTGDTALLEARFICGRHTISDTLVRALFLQRDLASFIEDKLAEQQQRHAKSQGAGSQLEPNIKTCHGGLRDVHTMAWLSKAQGLDTRFHALVDENILTRTEAARLAYSHKQLARLRIALHAVAGREEDRLIFDLQSPVAAFMGIESDSLHRASEKLMRMLYRATKAIKQLDGILLPMLQGRVFMPWPRHVRHINEQYYQVGELLAVEDKNLFQKDPHELFILLEIAQQTDQVLGVAPQTLRAWWAAAQKINQEFYQDPQNRRRFIGFFRHGRGLTHILRFMNLYGVLGRYLPAFGKIVGLLQHDLFHIYPVDDHILMVVRNMRRLAIDDHSHELPLASDLMQNFEKKHILYLSALFHDIAKGRGGRHEILGVADARQFARDHFLTQEESDLLAWLVEDHLMMSLTAQKEDIQDPDVIARFCQKVQTQERLIALYLLTVCDIRGTNPKIWNSWKANLLECLFHAALDYLNSSVHPSLHVIALRRQHTAIEVLNGQDVTPAEQQKIWHLLGPAYFVRHENQEIAWHMHMLNGHWHEAQFHIRTLPETKTMEIMVYMPNREKLFAQLSQIFSRQNLDILTARIFVTAHNYILDTFVVNIPPQLDVSDYPRIQTSLNHKLTEFIQGHFKEIAAPAKPASRRTRHQAIAPQITLVQEDNEDLSLFVLNVVTTNRSGLLANILAVLSDFHISIHYAKISTLDERVEDSFLIHSKQLENTNFQLKVKEALLEQLSA